MSSLSALILSSCVGLTDSSYPACINGLNALGKQSGIEQKVDFLQEKSQERSYHLVRYLITDTGISIVGGSAFLYKTIKEKSIQLNPPNMGLCEKITSQIGDKNYNLKLEWSF